MELLATLFLGLMSLFYSADDSILDQIKARGEIHVVTRQSPTTFYEDEQGKAGLEYELAKSFADELGVRLKLSVAKDYTSVFAEILNRKVDFAAAGLTVTSEHKSALRFSPTYQIITQQLVYHKEAEKPPENLLKFEENHILHVVAGSHQIERLKAFKLENPKLVWKEISDTTPSDLLEEVFEKKANYAMVNSNEFSQVRRFYPELEVAFELPKRQVLAWAFPRIGLDDSLYIAAIDFFNRLQKSGKLSKLMDRYYGHIDAENFNYFNARVFRKHIKTRLPKYQKYFEQTAEKHGLDWRFLAAIGYQESKWNPKAVSFTGVRGLMMLTEAAAEEMGVTNREDPIQSIRGGTRYFLATKDRIPEDVQEPDRTWFALAAYNVGFGHLLDARKLTRRRGGDPNHWVDLKKNLPLLSQHYWYRQTRHGRARGHEPVHFVKNIRRFYDILTHLDEKEEKNTFKIQKVSSETIDIEKIEPPTPSEEPLPLKTLPSQEATPPNKEPPLNTEPPPSIPVL